MTAFSQRGVKEGGSQLENCRPFAVYSGPRVLRSLAAQLPLGYSIPQVTYPRHLDHVFNPEFSAVRMCVCVCVKHARSDGSKGRIPSTEFRQQKA